MSADRPAKGLGMGLQALLGEAARAPTSEAQSNEGRGGVREIEVSRIRPNPDLSILGVALTMFDRRNNLSQAVSEDVRACLGQAVFETVVPRNVRLSEAPSHGLPALIYDLKCPGSEAYIRLAREVIGRLPSLAVAA